VQVAITSLAKRGLAQALRHVDVDAVVARDLIGESGRCRRIVVEDEDPTNVERVAQRGKLNASLLAAAADRCDLRLRPRQIARRHGRCGAGALDRDLDRVEQRERRAAVSVE
jgi:hypothetical protein